MREDPTAKRMTLEQAHVADLFSNAPLSLEIRHSVVVFIVSRSC